MKQAIGVQVKGSHLTHYVLSDSSERTLCGINILHQPYPLPRASHASCRRCEDVQRTREGLPVYNDVGEAVS